MTRKSNLINSNLPRKVVDNNAEIFEEKQITNEFNNFLINVGPSPVGIYLLKVNNRNTRTRCEICSKLTIKTSERRHWRRFGIFIVNFEHISHVVLVFVLLTLSE